MSNLNPNQVPNPNRLKEVKEFDESKIGVKGLVDKGLTTIPTFFIHPSEPATRPGHKKHSIPVVDFSFPRSTLVDQIHRAATTLGFFQIINHSVKVEAINKIVGSVKSFNELPDEVKMKYYSRDMTRGAAYSTNFDLYNSKAASWRDTLQMRMHRQPEHVMTFLLAEMGTSGSLDGQQRLVIKGRFAPKNFEGILRRYVSKFLLSFAICVQLLEGKFFPELFLNIDRSPSVTYYAL